MQAVGELWLFSLTDHHILTRTSGYGKVRKQHSGLDMVMVLGHAIGRPKT